MNVGGKGGVLSASSHNRAVVHSFVRASVRSHRRVVSWRSFVYIPMCFFVFACLLDTFSIGFWMWKNENSMVLAVRGK